MLINWRFRLLEARIRNCNKVLKKLQLIQKKNDLISQINQSNSTIQHASE